MEVSCLDDDRLSELRHQLMVKNDIKQLKKFAVLCQCFTSTVSSIIKSLDLLALFSYAIFTASASSRLHIRNCNYI
jgi:hypothetical protein